MSKPIQREELQVGAIIEGTANPTKGKQYRITEVRKPSLMGGAYTTYHGECLNAERPEWIGRLTLNHIRRYFKLVPDA